MRDQYGPSTWSTNPTAELQPGRGTVYPEAVAAKRSPILGYNHNVRFRGIVFHVQTEDSGIVNPHVFTHLFHGGVIISTRKLVYDPDATEDVVKALMQAQHKAVMKDLKNGVFYEKIDQYLAGTAGLLPRGRTEPAVVDEDATTPRSKYFGLNMSPEKIMCRGCLSGPCSGSDLPEKNCPIRPCVIDRSLDNCAYCPDYPCDKMETRVSSYEEVARRFQGVIPQAEYDKFIAPYDSRKTLSEIGPQKGER